MFFDFEKYYNKKMPIKPLFIEVGANKGQWGNKIIVQYPDCIIYAIEPIPGITLQSDNIVLNNIAIDLEDNKQKELFITKDNVTSSLLELNRDLTNKFEDFVNEQGVLHKKSDLDVVETIKVNTKRLDTFINDHNIREINYLKIDTEGNDLNVFNSLGGLRKIVWGFEMEVWNEPNTLFNNSSWYNEIVPHIEKNGFKLVDKFIHARGLSSDLLFINNNFYD